MEGGEERGAGVSGGMGGVCEGRGGWHEETRGGRGYEGRGREEWCVKEGKGD